MAFSYNKKNLANTTITGAITPTQTSVTVADATVFSYAFFYATLMPSNEMSNASNSEIVLVTNIQGNTLTLVRGQENTIARSFPYGAVITNGIYTRDIDYARSIGRKVFMAQDDGTDDTNTSYQIVDPMIKNIPEEGSIITVEFDTPSYGAPTLGVNNGIGGLVQVSGKNIHITDSSGQVDSVGLYGDTEQETISGKNILPRFTSKNQNGITFTVGSDGRVVVSGTAASTTTCEVTGVVLTAGTYTLSGCPTGGSDSTYRLDGMYTSGGSGFVGYDYGSGLTFTLSASATIIFRIRVNSGAAITTPITFSPMLETGSPATSYEPYVGGTASPNPDYPQEVQTVTGRQVVTITDGGSQSQEYEINLGKNLCNPATLTADSRLSGDGSLLAGATGFSTSDYIPVEPNTTYTITRAAASSGFFGNLCQYNSSKTLVGTREYWDNSSSYWPYHITTSATTRYIRVSDQTTLFGTSFQLEKGSTASSFAPYFTPIELCKIGTYQDYIYSVNGDYYLHKEVVKISPDGTETWNSLSISNPDYIYCYTSAFDSIVKPKVWDGLLSDKFAVYDYSGGGYEWISPSASIKGACFSNGDNSETINLRVVCPKTTANSVGNFKTWLGNSRPVFYYPIKTPTDTQITNATLISELNALYNMLPEGVADVVVTGDLPGSLTIKYYQQGTGTYTAPIVGGAEIDGGDNEQVVELDSYLPYRLVYDTNGYWRVLNKGPKVTTGAIMDGAVTAAKITRDNINYGTTSSDTRIGTFLGKPLWRRVEKFTNIPTGYSVHYWAAGTISNLDSVVAVNGMWAANGSATYVPINSVPPDAVAAYGIGIRDFTASRWAVVLGTSMSTTNSGYIILDYTKTS